MCDEAILYVCFVFPHHKQEVVATMCVCVRDALYGKCLCFISFTVTGLGSPFYSKPHVLIVACMAGGWAF